jgi:uncharacterized protein
MSEFLNNHSLQTAKLLEYSKKLIAGENGKAVYDQYQNEIEKATADEAMEVLDQLLQSDIPFEVVKENVGKIMNVFYKSLNSENLPLIPQNHFLHYLMLENRAMEIQMQELKGLLKALYGADKNRRVKVLGDIREKVEQLRPYELHYIKKENILFPHIEKAYPSYRCIQLMWSFHDDFRKSIKSLSSMLGQEDVDPVELSREMGKLFFVVLPIIFREEKVVFPVALRYLPDEVWNEMLMQSVEVEWCYITAPEEVNAPETKTNQSATVGMVDLQTGMLTPEQIIMMMESLPLDITYIDENDEVCYFSGIKHRIFPRSKSIIGRKVQNCHPPSSVHIVNEIVAAFRSGERDVAEFWIQLKERFIHIRYFALRDESRNYRGTIEVSQDVTGIRELEGEQRLLEWK